MRLTDRTACLYGILKSPCPCCLPRRTWLVEHFMEWLCGFFQLHESSSCLSSSAQRLSQAMSSQLHEISSS
ncbi:hypothetical protein FQN60_000047 [Etheostoma spectabile]|uniref:Uncharacterized protein n=1 Tax=Etheostoma spectabile TaxID=54343 RepID=A0A5J5CEF9_9PERO|nr:hypothetical protein FQN60_000047 [Etheostoma spectabile]